MNRDERYSRQRDVVPQETLAQIEATVIGVGAIGRQVALQLGAIGVPRLTLIDFYQVEESNLASQGYLETDLGNLKTEATARACRSINSKLDVHTLPGGFAARWKSEMPYFAVSTASIPGVLSGRPSGMKRGSSWTGE